MKVKATIVTCHNLETGRMTFEMFRSEVDAESYAEAINGIGIKASVSNEIEFETEKQ